jgi:hypothetical protein
MNKYKGAILLPLTLKDTGVNPTSYPLMTFESDPNLVKGDRRTLRYVEKESYVDFNALLVNRSEYQEEDDFITVYVFEVEDREVALRIAKMIKELNPNMFLEDNLGVE